MKKLNEEKLKINLEKSMAKDQSNGCVGAAGLCVLQDGHEIYKSYFGKKSYLHNEEIKDGDRLIWRLASMTKPVTTAAVLIQVGRGQIDLDEPISHLMPAFAEPDIGVLGENNSIIRTGKAKTPLTARILLDHTNGLGTMAIGDVQCSKMTPADRYDLEHVTNFLSSTALAFEPMTAQFYSPCAAFDVCARLVELTSGMPFDRFVRENITEPCGMADMTFAPTADQWSRMAVMHNRIESTDESGVHYISTDSTTVPGCVFENFPVTWFCGGAGLASSMPDYVRFAEMLLNEGRIGDRQIIPVKQMREMKTPWVPESIMPKPVQWGLGVRVITGEYHMPVHCFGWSGAYGTHFWVDPDNRITAVYMKNSRYDGGAGSATSIQFEKDLYAALD